MKVKSKATGDPKVPKEHRFALKIVYEQNEYIKYFDKRMNLG